MAKMKLSSIYRDAFARGNVVRETVPKHERATCSWCGQAARFRYGWSDDQGSRHSHMSAKQFCSRSCERSYNGEKGGAK